MKALSVIAILTLLASTAWFGVKNAESERELEAMRDTLGSLRIKQQTFFDNYDRDVFKRIGESNLSANDTLIETHRITFDNGRFCALLRLEVKPDNSLRTVFKKFTYKNPLTGEGKDSLHVVSNPKIDFTTLQQFKAKLTQLEFPAAAVDDNILCCFGGGTMTWEAVEKSGTRYRFSTYCRQSEQFAEACEFLLRQVDDDYLKQKFN
jgi:hypothetical protein